MCLKLGDVNYVGVCIAADDALFKTEGRKDGVAKLEWPSREEFEKLLDEVKDARQREGFEKQDKYLRQLPFLDDLLLLVGYRRDEVAEHFGQGGYSGIVTFNYDTSLTPHLKVDELQENTVCDSFTSGVSNQGTLVSTPPSETATNQTFAYFRNLGSV